jgi:hypothetical protein
MRRARHRALAIDAKGRGVDSAIRAVKPSLGTGPPGNSGRMAKISVRPRSQALAGIMPPASKNAASDVPINAFFTAPSRSNIG